MAIIKFIHVSFALLSFVGFVLRGSLMMLDSPVMQTRWLRVVPHIVDTVLLVSAVVLAIQLGFSPGNSPWIVAKLVALVVYIGLGVVALRRGKTKQIRILAWLAALLVFVYMVLVATSKSPLPF